MATQNGLFAHKSKQVNGIQRHLASEFHPALKNVASAGQNLLKAYQNLSRQHYVYTASLNALAYSGASAEPEVQENVRQLEQITEALKAIHGEQIKWMDFFTKMTLTINQNCENEKERLKALQTGFARREKDLAKAVDRGKQSPREFETFYEKELAEMRDQQAQRYRFFVEKHLELLRHFLGWSRHSTALLEKEFDLGDGEGEEQGLLEGLEEVAQRQGSGQERKERRTSLAQVAEEQSSRRGSQKQMQLAGGRRLSSHISSGPGQQDTPPNIQNRPNVQQPTGQQGLFRPIPILPESQQKYRHSLALTEAVGRANGELSQWERQQMASLPAGHQKQPQMQPVIQQLQQFYRDDPPMGGTEQLDRVGQAQPVEQFMQHNNRMLGQFRHFGPGPGLPQKRISPLVTGNGAAGLYTFGHARGNSQESTTSSGLARATPPIFSASDYGRVVECTVPYEAQGENQLSLELGQRILLVKSGSRGWVLGRSEEGERQGWFPAKYLKLI